MENVNRIFDYTVLDVFTESKYTGNQLAVIQISDDLELSEYVKIAMEFGYSESSFVYYSNKKKTLVVRSFTSTGFEINGAGHNLLGVVCNSLIKKEDIFGRQGTAPFVIMKDETILLEINVSGTLPVVGMKQRSATLHNTVPFQDLAEGLTIDEKDFDLELFPTVVSTEVKHLMVPLKNVEVLDKVISNKKILKALSEQYHFEGIYCFSFSEIGTDNIVETRFFNPLIGIDEDPATGSAAGPLAGFLYLSGLISPSQQYQLLQGKILHRPSIIKFKIFDDSIVISGSSVITMKGKLYL